MPCAALVLLLVAPLLHAQTGETEPQAASPPACVFTVVDLSAGREHIRYEQLITEQLELELAAAGYQVIARPRVQQAREQAGYTPQELVAGEAALAVAAALEARLAVTGFYSVEGQRIVLELKAYDVAEQALITGILRTGQVNLSMFTLIDAAMAEMLPQVRLLPDSAQVQMHAGAPGEVRSVTLRSGDEEAAIYLPGDQFLGRIRQGALTLPPFPLPLGGTLTLVKKKPGYHDSEETIELAQPVVEASLRPLVKQTRWATELTYTTAQLLGFGLAQRYYPRPDVWFLAAENYLYVQHSFLPDNRPVFHDDLRLMAGGYPAARVDARFRVGLSAGLGLIATWIFDLDVRPFLDVYWNVLNVWFEWNWPRAAVFLRSEARYALGLPGGLLGQGMLGDGPILTAGVMRKW